MQALQNVVSGAFAAWQARGVGGVATRLSKALQRIRLKCGPYVQRCRGLLMAVIGRHEDWHVRMLVCFYSEGVEETEQQPRIARYPQSKMTRHTAWTHITW